MQNKTLQARISEDLYDKISKKAKNHRITISNLVRNLAEDYFEIHDEVWDLVDDKIRKMLKTKAGKKKVLGFQMITLTTDSQCHICEKELKKGDQINIAFFADSSKTAVVCSDCRKKEFGSEEK